MMSYQIQLFYNVFLAHYNQLSKSSIYNQLSKKDDYDNDILNDHEND